MPSSSSSLSISRWKYDVFLSFRGGDVRKNFADHLYDALIRRGIKTFRDENNLDKGKAIAAEILKAIEQSRSSVVLLSENYADSSWCLDEVVKILECKNYMGQIVFPVFYKVDPTDVDEQIGNFGEAFAKLEQSFGKNHQKVKQWRIALKELVNISGWDLQDRHESKFIQEIVEGILFRLNNSFSRPISAIASAEISVKNLERERIENKNKYHKVKAELEQALTTISYENLGISGELKQKSHGSTMFCYCSYGDAEYKSCSFVLSAHITKQSVPVSAVASFCQKIKNLIGGGQPFKNTQERLRMNSDDCPLIPFDILSKATMQFSNKCKLGEGGFGPVYKGTLNDGKEVAVKMLSSTSRQGTQEFLNEVKLIAKLRHKNIVRLMGCCLENSFALVYEYMPNRSLDNFIFGNSRTRLDWKKRLAIINGIAQGLLYLHEGSSILYLHEGSSIRIIHRDLKLSNVLLDYNMNPKISDFGLALMLGRDDNISTPRIVGTFGYMPPEYAMHGLVSVKLDVYSFGVMLLEIISGKKNPSFGNKQDDLIISARKLWSNGQGLGLMDMDASIMKSGVASEIVKCIHIALLCVQDDPAERPTMSSVVYMLSSDDDTITLPEPRQPALFSSTISFERSASWSSAETCSVNGLTLSDVSAR